MTIEYDLQTIKSVTDTALRKIKANPEKALISDLMQELKQIDANYQQFCGEFDEDNGEEYGTTYKTGISIEWEIEASWWHKVSEILREIK